MGRRTPYKGADRFTVAARQAGYPARSVFKLEEIDHRVRLLRPGMHVLDLGACPGSWTLYASERVGARGRVVSMDLNPLTVAPPENVTFFVGDALSLENADLAAAAPYDVVLSDMAPNTTGNRFADQARSFDLFMRALDVAAHLVKPGGSFVGKIFMGEDFDKAKRAVKELFAVERVLRPEGVRAVSYEVFLVGTGRRASSEGPP